MNSQKADYNPSVLTTFVIFLLITAAGLIPRLFMINTPYGFVHDWDWSVFGVQAYDMLQGEFRAYRYAQFYLGSFPMLIDTINFFIFGPSRAALFLGGLYYWVAYLLTTYFITKRIFSDKIAGLFAMACASISPVMSLYLSCEPSRAYLDVMIWGHLIFLVTLTIAANAGKKAFYWLLLGLFGGICFWTSFLSMYFLVPAFALVVLANPKRLLSFGPWTALAGFMVGSTPFWVHNLVNSTKFITFTMVHVGGEKTSFLFNIKAFLYKFKGLLGLNFNGFWLSLLSLLTLLIVIAALVTMFTRSGITKIRSVKDLSDPKKSGALLLFMAFCVCALMYTSSGKYTSMRYGHRYVMPLFNVIYPAIGFFLCLLYRKSRTLLLIAVVLFFGSRVRSQIFDNPRFKRLAVEKVRFAEYNKSSKQVIDYFKSLGAQTVSVSNGDVFDIILSMDGAPKNIAFMTPLNKYKPVDPLLMDDNEELFILSRHPHFQTQAQAMGFEMETKEFGPFKTLAKFKTKLNNSVLVPSSHYTIKDNTNKPLPVLSDTNVNTGINGADNTYISINLNDHIELDHIYFSYKSDVRSAPAIMKVEGSHNNKDWNEIENFSCGLGLYNVDGRIIYRPGSGLIDLNLAQKDAYKHYRFTMRTDTQWWLDEIYITEKIPGEYKKLNRKQIAAYIASTPAKTVYADEYTAARILLRYPELRTFNEYYWEGLAKPRRFENRRMDFSKTTGIVVPNVFAPQVEKLLAKYELEFTKTAMNSRTVFIVAPSKLPAPLFWLGLTIAEYYEQARSENLYSKALGAKTPEEKLQLVNRSLEFNPQNYLSLKLKQTLLQKEKNNTEKLTKLNTQLSVFTPAHEAQMSFENDLQITGYTLTANQTTGTISVTANVNKEISSQSRLIIMGLDKDEKVLFLVETEPYTHRTYKGVYQKGQKLVFTTSFAIPEKPMQIWLGLYDGSHKRVKVNMPERKKQRAQYIDANTLDKLIKTAQLAQEQKKN